MKVLILVMLSFFFAQIYGQDFQFNLCGITKSGNNSPTQKEDCWTDNSIEKFKCCYVTIPSYEGNSLNLCYPLPENADEDVINENSPNLIPGYDAIIECSAQFISVANIAITIVALILL
jgi:hypothetical protein